jgi:membrane protein implicated in regulation of membrane protease activity
MQPDAGTTHHRRASLAVRLGRATVLGLPVQFAAVVVVAAALVVYLSGWAALSRVEARSDSYHAAAFGEPVVQSRPGVTSSVVAEQQTWERVALFVCPLH